MRKNLCFFFITLKTIHIMSQYIPDTYRDRPGRVWPGETWRWPPPAAPSPSGGCRRCCSWIRIPRCPCPWCRTSARCCGSPRLQKCDEGNWGHYVRKIEPWPVSAGDSAALDLTTASRKRLKSINVWRQWEKEERRKILFVPWLDSDQMQSDLKKKIAGWSRKLNHILRWEGCD